MAKDLVVTSRIIIPAQELRFTYARSGGPGGQNVNKVSSKAILRWNVTESSALSEAARKRFIAQNKNRLNDRGEIVISSERYRDQPKNATDCLAKLRALLRTAATPPKKRVPTKAPRAAKESRLKTKRERAEKKSRRREPDLSD